MPKLQAALPPLLFIQPVGTFTLHLRQPPIPSATRGGATLWWQGSYSVLCFKHWLTTTLVWTARFSNDDTERVSVPHIWTVSSNRNYFSLCHFKLYHSTCISTMFQYLTSQQYLQTVVTSLSVTLNCIIPHVSRSSRWYFRKISCHSRPATFPAHHSLVLSAVIHHL